MVWEDRYTFRRGERSKQGIIQKRNEDRRRNSDFKLLRYSLSRSLRSIYLLKEMDMQQRRKTQEFA